MGRTAAAGLAEGKPGTLAPTGRACPEEAGEHRPAFSTANTNAPMLWERGEAGEATLNAAASTEARSAATKGRASVWRKEAVMPFVFFVML